MQLLPLALLAACAAPADDEGVVRRSSPPDDPADTDGPEDTGSEGEDASTPLPAPGYLDTSTVVALADTLDALFEDTRRGIRIVDAENGQVVYEYDPDAPLTPASNTKLYATAAAMDGLGEDHRLMLSAWAPAAPDGSGRVSDLTVLAEHDATWSTYVLLSSAWAAERLADALYDAGVRRVTGTLALSGEVLVDGDSVGTYDADDHRAAGIDVLAEALEDRGIAVGDTAVSASLETPTGVELAAYASPTLGVVCHPVNVYSHNEMADLLARHAGWTLTGDGSYAGGEEAMLDLLDALGVDAGEVAFLDGSGLSHDNAVTATSTSELLLAMLERPAGQAWERTFSIAGVAGTIGARMTGDDTYGRVYAKTGTLWNVVALSGVLHHRHDGHRYVFSILQDDVTSTTAARGLADAAVEALAADLRASARPSAPVLQHVRNTADGRISVAWDGVDGAEGYGVWVSADGRTWDRGDAVHTTGTEHVLRGLPGGATVYVRVTALAGDAESEASDVYAATPSDAPSRVLLVDANDRWEGQWENTRGAGHDFLRATAEAMPGRAVDSASNEALSRGAVSLDDYDVVVWSLGEESTADATFDDAERAMVAAWLTGDRGLLVSGAELAWDLDEEGTDDERAFLADTLRAAYAGDDAGTWTVEPVAGGMFDGLGDIGFYTPARLVIDYPDRLVASGGATEALAYVGGSGGAAAVAWDGDGRVVTLGFPVESIDGVDARTAVLERILAFLGA
jgi:D-alanyl-D-alanine carboxypeptidase